jgi:hypothetical protein
MFPIRTPLAIKQETLYLILSAASHSTLYCLRTVTCSVQAEIVTNAVEKSTLLVEQKEGEE